MHAPHTADSGMFAVQRLTPVIENLGHANSFLYSLPQFQSKLQLLVALTNRNIDPPAGFEADADKAACLTGTW